MSDFLTPHAREEIRTILQRLLAEEGGNKTALERRLGISRVNITNIIEGSSEPGKATILALCKETGRTFDDLRGYPSGGEADDLPVVFNLQGYKEAEAEAKRVSKLPLWGFDRARKVRGLAPPDGAVTLEWVLDHVRHVVANTPKAQQIEDTRKAIEKRIKTAETKALNKIAKKTA